jgi:hypothetical protein
VRELCRIKRILIVSVQGKVLWFHCGFKTHFRQRFEICGATKSVTIDDLVLPTFGRNGFVVTSSALTKNDIFTIHDREVVECDEAPQQVSEKLVKKAGWIHSDTGQALSNAHSYP